MTSGRCIVSVGTTQAASASSPVSDVSVVSGRVRVAQGLVDLAGHSEPVRRHGQLPGDRDDGPLFWRSSHRVPPANVLAGVDVKVIVIYEREARLRHRVSEGTGLGSYAARTTAGIRCWFFRDRRLGGLRAVSSTRRWIALDLCILHRSRVP